MRAAVVMMLACACGGDETAPIGDVTVTIYSDGIRATHTFPPTPIANAHVFVDGATTAVLTDAEGTATVAVSRAASTIHVVTPDGSVLPRLYTITDVPVGADILVGKRVVSESAGQLRFTLPALAGAMYELATPSGCWFAMPASASPTFTVYYQATCGGKTVRVYGFATEPSGALHVVERDVTVMNQAVDMTGPYADAAAYSLDVTNLPAGIMQLRATTGVLSADGRYFTPGGSAAAGAPPTITGLSAPTTDAISLVAIAQPNTSSSLIVRRPFSPGPSTLDGTALVPIPTPVEVSGKTASWTLDAAGRTVDGFVLETKLGDVPWTVHGGTTTKVTAPSEFPSGVPAITGPLRTDGHDLTTYDVLGEPRRFDLDQSYRSWRGNGLLPAQGVAFAVSL